MMNHQSPFNYQNKERKVLHKVKKNWVVLSLTSLTLFGASLAMPEAASHALPGSASFVSADSHTTFGQVSYTYDTATDTLTFTSGGTLPTASTSRLSKQFPHLKHIVFTERVQAPADSTNLFAQLVYLQDITGLDKLDTSQVTSMNAMFNSDYALTSLDLSTWNTDKVTDMSWMFTGDKALSSLNVSHFNTANVTNMMVMFNGIGVSSLDVSNFNTGKVTNMSDMFSWMRNLKSLDLRSWDTSNVTVMDYMFRASSSLSSLNISSFNTTHVTSMKMMFDQIGNGQLINVKLPEAHFDNNAGLGDRYSTIMAVNGGTLVNPKGNILSTADYQSLFNTGKQTADWYVWGTLATQTEQKTVTRTINQVDARGQQIEGTTPITQTLHFHRTKTTLPGTDYAQYGNWVADGDSGSAFEALTIAQTLDNNRYQNPTLNGQSVTTVERLQPSLDNNSSQTLSVNIVYADGSESTTQNKQVTRTIKYQNQAGQKIKDDRVETLHFHRTASTDLVTGQVTYSNWQADSANDQQFKTVQLPQTIDNKYCMPTLNGKAVQTITGSLPTLDDQNNQSEILTVVYADQTKVATEHQSISRTIHYQNHDGRTIKKDTVQTINYHRTVTKNLVSGEVIYSEWMLDESSLNEFSAIFLPQTIDGRYQNPQLNGEPISEIDPEMPIPDAGGQYKNQVITVVYDGIVRTSTQQKSVMRTIHYQNEDGQTIAEDTTQRVNYTRTVRSNLANGTVEYGAWQPVNGSDNLFNAVTIPSSIKNQYEQPTLNGQSVQEIKAEAPKLTDSDEDQQESLVVVYEKKNEPTPPVKPDKPTTPTPPVLPDQPVVPVTPEPPVQPDKPVVPNTPQPVEPNKPVVPNIPQPVEPNKPAPQDVPTSPVEPQQPVTPDTPVAPEVPVTPEVPAVPVNPVQPAIPVVPEQPVQPELPAAPEQPVQPETPVTPVTPEQPAHPEKPEVPEQPVQPETPLVPEQSTIAGISRQPIEPDTAATSTTPVPSEQPGTATIPAIPEMQEAPEQSADSAKSDMTNGSSQSAPKNSNHDVPSANSDSAAAEDETPKSAKYLTTNKNRKSIDTIIKTLPFIAVILACILFLISKRPNR